jgi:hypothetical protein
VQTLLNRVIKRVVRRLERDGLLIPDPEQPWLDLDFHEPMDSLSAASIRYRIAIGPHSGSRTLTLHDPSFIRTDKSAKALTADRDGFSLNAAVSCQSYQRNRLERLGLGVPAGTQPGLLFVWSDSPSELMARFNMTFRKASCEWISTLHIGWAWKAYRDNKFLERLIAGSSLQQRAVMGFPQPGSDYWCEETIVAVKARYGMFGMDMSPYREAIR